MKIENPRNLPQSLVNACSVEKHNKEGEVSATTLLKGTKQIILEERHWEELTDTVDNRIWAILGTSVHKLLEEKNPNAFTEEKFECQIGEKKVVGHVDLYDMENAEITDYKTTSVWKIKFAEFEDWRKQGLVYAYLLKKSNLEVKRCRFIAMLRDWSKGEAQRNPDYPQSQIYEYVFEITEKDLAEIERFITEKVCDISKNEKLSDDEIPECNEEERWQSATTYAVKKEGRKTAIKVFGDKEEAEKNMVSLGGTFIEERKGCAKRCSDYCLCNGYCSFYKKTLSNN